MRPDTSAHSFKLALLDDLTWEICWFLQLNTANDPERIQEIEGETCCGTVLEMCCSIFVSSEGLEGLLLLDSGNAFCWRKLDQASKHVNFLLKELELKRGFELFCRLWNMHTNSSSVFSCDKRCVGGAKFLDFHDMGRKGSHTYWSWAVCDRFKLDKLGITMFRCSVAKPSSGFPQRLRAVHARLFFSTNPSEEGVTEKSSGLAIRHTQLDYTRLSWSRTAKAIAPFCRSGCSNAS